MLVVGIGKTVNGKTITVYGFVDSKKKTIKLQTK